VRVLVILAILIIFFSFIGFSDSFAEEIKSKKLPVLFEQFFYFFDYETIDGVLLTELRTSRTSIIMILESYNEGNLRVNLPPDLIKTRYKCVGGGSEDIFVIINGIEVKAEKIEQNGNANIVYDIFLQKGNFEVELIFPADQGSWAFPEGCPIKFFQNAISYKPLKQLEKGVNTLEIICKKELNLIFKSTDNSPACVKPTTVDRLIERGWAHVPIEENLKLKIQNNQKLSNEIKNSILSGNSKAGFLGNPCDSIVKICLVKIELFNGTDSRDLPPLLKKLGFWKNMVTARLTFEDIQTISEFSEVKKISSGQTLR